MERVKGVTEDVGVQWVAMEGVEVELRGGYGSQKWGREG